MKLLFLVPYPLEKSPSQRFRFEQYFDTLVDKGHTIEVQSFLTDFGWNIIYSDGHRFKKALAVISGFARRFVVLPMAARADFIFIHREAAPLGPPAFEWIIARILRKKVIYDFDDAIWMTDRTNEGSLARALRHRSKVGSICRWSYKVSCGNEFLCDYARRFNQHVVYNPTTIDTRYHLAKSKSRPERITIGWTGSHTTLKYLSMIVPVLIDLENKFPGLDFLVIANKKPDLPLKSLKFLQWNETTEIDDLNKIDIGIMPLPDDEWSKGKCGFKALQYMSVAIPTIASRVGVNTRIIENDVNGFLCSTAEEWRNAIERLIHDEQLRERIGQQGKSTVEKNYSVTSNTSNFLSLFEENIS